LILDSTVVNPGESDILVSIKKQLVTETRTQLAEPKLSSLIYKRKQKVLGTLSSADSTDSLPDKLSGSENGSPQTPPSKQLTKSGSDVFFKSVFGRKKDKPPSNSPLQD
jgi:hypothetical protein